MVHAYCLKCRKKMEIRDPVHRTLKNGAPATSGTCPRCGTKMFKFDKRKKDQGYSALTGGKLPTTTKIAAV